MGDLASLAEKLGHRDDAITWWKRAYDESKGPVTRFRWSMNYVTGFIRNRPADNAAIEQATLSVLGELGSADDLHGSNSSRLQRLEKALRKWNADGKHGAVLRAAQGWMKVICGAARSDGSATSATGGAAPDATEACRGFLSG